MPDISRRRFVTVVGGGAVASGVAVGASVVGRGKAPHVTSRGRGRWTGFGTVAVLAATRQDLVAVGAGAHHQHGVGNVPASHRTWSETIRVSVEVHNGTDKPILASPGQFRLRVGSAGSTVSPYDAGWSVGPLAASETVASWISYLAPPGNSDLWLEYAEPAGTGDLTFALAPEVAS